MGRSDAETDLTIGFVHTYEKPNADRLWRKSREINAGSKCIGVDLNRNWPHMYVCPNTHHSPVFRNFLHTDHAGPFAYESINPRWDIPGGSSRFPCDETFRGSGSGSTVEIQSLIKGLETINQTHGGISLYIDWHSYSQLILSRKIPEPALLGRIY